MALWSDNYYRSQLTPEQMEDYDRIYEGWMRYETDIRVSARPFAPQETNCIVQAVACDHPEIFWVNFYQYSIKQTGIPGVIRRQSLVFQNFFDHCTIEGLKNQAESWKQRICSQIHPGNLPKDKVWLLYDYLARQVSYGDKGIAQAHTIIGCFLPHNHVTVCEGIAKGFKYLCSGIDLPCIIVCGTLSGYGIGAGGGHAWNMIFLENQFRHLDVTGELVPVKRSGHARRAGFFYTDAELRRKGYAWEETHLPAAQNGKL